MCLQVDFFIFVIVFSYLYIFFVLISVLSLQELCCRAIVARTTVYSIEQLPLPISLKSCLKSYSMTTYKSRPHIPNTRDKSLKKTKQLHHPCDSLTSQCRKSCSISQPITSFAHFTSDSISQTRLLPINAQIIF